MKRDFLTIDALEPREVKDILAGAKVLKHMDIWSDKTRPLDGSSVALIFRKPSLRTRVSFDVGVHSLGGHPMVISDAEIGIGKRESVQDIANVLSRFVSLIVIRTFAQTEVEELARFSEVPVINALTDLLHPCQIMGDALTIMEHHGSIDGIKIAYLGDGNNIVNSWLNFSKKIKIDLRIGTSPNTLPNAEILASAQSAGISKITITHNPIEAVSGVDVIYTDVWASMGEKDRMDEKSAALKSFQVNAELLKHASKHAIVMHCLPANRGHEITDDVIDGPQSVVFDQAENRLHIQKAIMQFLTTGLV
jgi:ornithine carbamoyltransferase